MGKKLNQISKGCTLDDMNTFCAKCSNLRISDPEISSNCDTVKNYVTMLSNGQKFTRKSNAQRLSSGFVVTKSKDLCVLPDGKGFCSLESSSISPDGLKNDKTSSGFSIILNEDGRFHLFRVSLKSKNKHEKRSIEQIKEYFFNYEPRKQDPAFGKVVHSAHSPKLDDAPYAECTKAIRALLAASLDFDGMGRGEK